MSGPGRRKKVIIIIIIVGRLALNDNSYNSVLNLSAALLPTVDDLSGSFAADTGNAIDTFAGIVGDDPDNPNSFTETQLAAYTDALGNYISGL
jgi:hypothetical protein